MIFEFKCRKCKKELWFMSRDMIEKVHYLKCANCGDELILEDLNGRRRRKKNVKKKPNPIQPNQNIDELQNEPTI